MNAQRPCSSCAPFTVHHFKTWTRCQKKYHYDTVKKLRWPTDQSRFRLGRTIHKLFEFQAKGLAFDFLLEEAEPDVQKTWALLMDHPITQLPVIESEWGFTTPLGNYWLTGRIDRIAQDKDYLLILDWKTGTSAPTVPDLDWQTVVYLYALAETRQELGVPHLPLNHIRFVYVDTQKGEEIRELSVPYSEENHASAKERLLTTLDEMTSRKTVALPPKCPDPFCAYRPICGIESTL